MSVSRYIFRLVLHLLEQKLSVPSHRRRVCGMFI